jgi:hypothetical protein
LANACAESIADVFRLRNPAPDEVGSKISDGLQTSVPT